jgi:DNA primase
MFNVKQELEKLGLNVARDDGQEYALYCPFHHNTDSPAFSINKKTGLWCCFNPDCNQSGSLSSLSAKLGGTFHEHREIDIDDILQSLNDSDEELQEEVAEDWEEAMERVSINYDSNETEKLDYLVNRGFHLSTLKHFGVGYSEKKGVIVIPARDEHYRLKGFIGRHTDEKIKPKYKYSKGFPRKGVLFNLNNAKHYGTAIVVEGSLDAMMVHQAGFPNVVATLGANVTDEHIQLLNHYFNEIIIFYDNDDPGRKMRDRICQECPMKELRLVIYGNDAKDPGDLTVDQIRDMITDSVDYLSWSFNESVI